MHVQDGDGGHNYAHNDSGAAAMGLKGGCDIAIHLGFGSDLTSAFEEGLCTQSDLQATARRTLGVRMRSGDFDPPFVVSWSDINSSVLESDAHHLLAREVASASFVLLKHRPNPLGFQLPLSDKLSSIAVIGRAGNSTRALIGRGSYTGQPKQVTTILQGLQGRASDTTTVEYNDGDNISTAMSLVANSTAAIVCLTPFGEGEMHDRSNISLPEEQTH